MNALTVHLHQHPEIKIKRIRSFAIVAALLLSPATVWPVSASDETSAQTVGALCVPDSATIREGIYETLGFGVHIASGRVGKVRLMCPLHADEGMSTIAAMTMSIIDTDGMEIGGRIRTHLHRAHEGSNVGEIIGTCDSNTSNKKTPHELMCNIKDVSTCCHHNYWVEVLIERTDPKVEVEFLAAAILRDL